MNTLRNQIKMYALEHGIPSACVAYRWMGEDYLAQLFMIERTTVNKYKNNVLQDDED